MSGSGEIFRGGCLFKKKLPDGSFEEMHRRTSMSDGNEIFEIFEIGEPVFLLTERAPVRVWWIKSFRADASVLCATRRNPPADRLVVTPVRLVKLNAMERIAAELED